MTSATVAPHTKSPYPEFSRVGAAVPVDVVEELCAQLFHSFRRKDQRLKATQYVRGLLTTEGRKSIRNIAATVGEPAAVQSLHHFIASSTWDWRPVRTALADHLETVAPPLARVVQPMAVPKAGEHTVGVCRIIDPQLGQTFWGQQAFGVWSVAPPLGVPIHWRLFLPGLWGHDDVRRNRAEVPQKAGGETYLGCAVAAALTAPHTTAGLRRPVVLNVPGSATRATMARFAAASAPVLTRTTGSSPLEVADRAMPGFGAGVLPAQAILESIKGLRRPVPWHDPARPRQPGRSLAVAVPVGLPNEAGGRQRRLLLLGEWSDPEQPPDHLWLTNMVGTPLPRLVELVHLVHTVDRDAARTGEAVGLRDFVGRSFRGWHRHITLASVAHALTALHTGAPYGTFPPVL